MREESRYICGLGKQMMKLQEDKFIHIYIEKTISTISYICRNIKQKYKCKQTNKYINKYIHRN